MRRIAAGLLLTLAAVLVLGASTAHAAPTTRATITWQESADVDLHIYDAEGHHAYYAVADAIPDGLLSGDNTSAGSETFTDQREPSSRSFGYQVCYFSGG